MMLANMMGVEPVSMCAQREYLRSKTGNQISQMLMNALSVESVRCNAQTMQ